MRSAGGSQRGGGNGLPSPPECLHECGGSRGTQAESRGTDEDVESCSHQQFDQKGASSRRFSKRCCMVANPGASTTFALDRRRRLPTVARDDYLQARRWAVTCHNESYGWQATIFFNRSGAYVPVPVASPFLHQSPRHGATASAPRERRG